MTTLGRDVRYGLRLLSRSPLCTVVAVVTLALGIGASSAIFSVVLAVVIRPLPYARPESLVYVGSRNQTVGVSQGFISPSDVVDYRERSRSFEELAAYTTWPINLMRTDRPERLEGILVTTNFFKTFGVAPSLGRAFTQEDGEPGRDRVVMLSHGLWRRQFGGDPQVVGRHLTLDADGARDFTIIGVMPAEFQFPVNTDLWMPEDYQAQTKRAGARFVRVVARLKHGVSARQSEADLNATASALAREFPQMNANWSVTVTPLREHLFGKTDTALLVLLGAVGILLLLACANVATLQLARATRRRREIVLRTALGANRRQLARQLITENMLLSSLGGGLGLLLAVWFIAVLRSFGPQSIPRIDEVGVSLPMLGFTLLLTLVTGFVFGLVPALHLSEISLSEALKAGGRSSGVTVGRNRVRNALIVSQVAMACILLTSAGLLIKSFYRLSEVSPGFRADNVLAVSISLTNAEYPKTQRVPFFREVVRRVKALPGVNSVGLTSYLPLGGRSVNLPFNIEGQGPTEAGSQLDADIRVISPEYFRTLGIPLEQGRDFGETDDEAAPGVVIINELCARRFFDGRDAVGQRLTVGTSLFEGEIVGVVGDVKHRGLESEARPEIYIPYTQNTIWPVMNLVVRATGESERLAPSVRAELQAIDKSVPVYNVKTMEQLLSDSLAQRRFNVLWLSLFAAVALVLAVAGVYGVLAYFVALGLAGAFALTRTMSSLLYGVSSTDALIFGGVPLLLVLVTLLASYIPARRAAGIDPVLALRNE
ncbi:MAG TPA: ABC transporter permease [Pyrinomonadaceae bacterium]